MYNSFFCPLPWNHLMFKQSGTVQACCESWKHQFKPSKTIKETANDPVMKQLRLDILDPNKVPDMCWSCEGREKLLANSVRIHTQRLHEHWTPESAQAVTNADGSVDNFYLEHLDIRWSNLCNYKCRFCGLVSSHSWLNDAKLLGQEPTQEYNPKTGIAEYDMDWEDLKTHLSHVRYCKLAGGEPTIMSGTYQLLEELIRIGNTSCQVSLITNGTTIQYGKYNLIELLKNFKNVKIQISLEGMGARHAWARSGKDDWHIIEKNVDQFISMGNEYDWIINFHSGISWMNMFHLSDFIMHYPNTPFTLNIVSNPTEMSIQNFYKKDLQRCSEHYEKLIPSASTDLVKQHLIQVKNALDTAMKTSKEDVDLDKFRSIQGILDTSRKQSFANAYPEWSHYA